MSNQTHCRFLKINTLLKLHLDVVYILLYRFLKRIVFSARRENSSLQHFCDYWLFEYRTKLMKINLVPQVSKLMKVH